MVFLNFVLLKKFVLKTILKKKFLIIFALVPFTSMRSILLGKLQYILIISTSFFAARGVRKVTTGITGLWRRSVQSDAAF